VKDGDGRWFSLRVRPYVTLESKIDGASIVLVDIDTIRRHADPADRPLAWGSGGPGQGEPPSGDGDASPNPPSEAAS
jgi:hypothetical protein